MLSAMPNLAHPLFSVPAEAIDTEMVGGFLALRLEESYTLDYKRNIDAAADTVAAMANTYGGVILIGVDTDPKDENLPGGLVSVSLSDKDRLVSKMATTFDPPGWTPDVIPVTVDGKQLLVVRIDPDSVSRPLFHKGVVRVRLDGRNLVADRRLVQILFQEANKTVLAPAHIPHPRFAPDLHATPHNRSAYRRTAPPDLVIRAAVSRPLRRATTRLRLHGATVDALMRALGTPGTHELPTRLKELAQRVNSQQFQQPWTIDPEQGHARFIRLTAGHQHLDVPSEARVRAECAVTLDHSGTSLEVLFDLLFWTGGQKVANELWVQACYEAVRALVHDVLPALTEALLGTAAVPTPPVELHIASGKQHLWSLENLINTALLGDRIGNGNLSGGSDYLPDDLVATGNLPGAVAETLRDIALDWRYLHPSLPPLHD